MLKYYFFIYFYLDKRCLFPRTSPGHTYDCYRSG